MTYSPSRKLIAEEAARLLHEEGYRDYHLAKQKAVTRLGETDGSNRISQPSNNEIYNALLSRCTLYANEESKQHLNELRKVAIEAMTFLYKYSPLLTGSVMDSTAGKHAPITLHLFSSSPEEIIFFLEDNRIPFQTDERKITIKNKQEVAPLLRFFADDFEIELLLLSNANSSIAPISAITGKAMKRVSIKEVKKLLL